MKKSALLTGILCLLAITGCSVEPETNSPKEDEEQQKVTNDFSLSETSLNLYVGEAKQIFARTNPESQYCTWKSSNESVATVTTIGQISALNEGTCEISATVGEITHVCSLTVTVDEIVLNKSTLDLNITTTPTYQFTCSYKHSSTTPNVTWAVDKESLASISSSGLLTLKGVGEVNVAATLKENITASCKVTITGPNDYYVLESAGNAEVVANPGKWYYHTDGSNTHFTTSHSQGKVTLVMDSNGANKTYLRYMPSNVPDVYQAEATITVSKACAVRLGGGRSSEYEFVTFTASSLTQTVKWRHRHNESGANCLSILVLNSEGSSDYAKNFTITVTDPVASKDIAFDKTSINLDLDKNKTAQLVIAGGDSYSFESSNTDVATVNDSGLVTAVANGNAIITATSGELTATCNISVKNCEITFTEAYHVFESLTPYTIEFSTKGIDNENDIVWTSSDESVATVSNGVVTPVSGGCAVITADYDGVTATFKAVIEDETSLITGTMDVTNLSSGSDPITNPGKFYKYQTYVNKAEFIDSELVLTNTSKAIDTTSSSNRVQQIRYCVKNSDGGFYNGQYYISLTFTNNTRTALNDGEPTNAKLTVTNGADTSISINKTSTTGSSVKMGIVLSANGTASTYTKLSFKSFGYGTMTVSDIHIILMGE